MKKWSGKPLLLCADIEEGVGQRFYGGTKFVPPMGIAQIYKKDQTLAISIAEKIGYFTGKEAKKIAEQSGVKISSFNIIYELIDFVKSKMSGLLSPDVEESITGSAEILEIFKVSKVGKVAGSKVTTGEISQDSLARVIRDGTVVFTGKIGSIFREKNQTKQVTEGLECGITLKNFNDFQKKDIIEAYNSKTTERSV